MKRKYIFQSSIEAYLFELIIFSYQLINCLYSRVNGFPMRIPVSFNQMKFKAISKGNSCGRHSNKMIKKNGTRLGHVENFEALSFFRGKTPRSTNSNCNLISEKLKWCSKFSRMYFLNDYLFLPFLLNFENSHHTGVTYWLVCVTKQPLCCRTKSFSQLNSMLCCDMIMSEVV